MKEFWMIWLHIAYDAAKLTLAIAVVLAVLWALFAVEPGQGWSLPPR